MQKIILVCLILLIILFTSQLKYGSGGYIDDSSTVKQIGVQTLANESLANRNNMMEMNILGLKGSVDALEARARYELNLVKSGEILVVLPSNYTIKVPPKNNKQP